MLSFACTVWYYKNGDFMQKQGFRYYAGEWERDHITVVDKTLDWPVGIHTHSFFEIEIFLKGSGRQNLNGTVYPIEAGTLLFLTPIDFHSVEPGEELRIINISFDSEMIPPHMQLLFMNRRSNLLFKLSQDQSESLLSTVDMMKKECDTEDGLSADMRKHLLGVVLGFIARMYLSGGGAGESAAGNVQSSIKYIFDHFRDDITLSQVAAASGYTPNYFSKLFSDLTGRRYVDFLNSLRVNYAKMLLSTTKQSVIDISRASGFSSLSNFARVFKGETGLTPLEFRQKSK